MSLSFCTLAIHAPYRRRARQLIADAPGIRWTVLTDAPEDFADLPVRAIHHAPTGPMAADYLARLPVTGGGNGAAAYHDKRFALRAALEESETAIFVDADSRMGALPEAPGFPVGLSVLPVVRKSVAEHLETCGTWRTPAFVDLALELTGGGDILREAWWCHETCMAITRDGRESAFFDAWGRAAAFMQERGVYSGEGGVIGLAAACAGWGVDFEGLNGIGAAVRHEGNGPKAD